MSSCRNASSLGSLKTPVRKNVRKMSKTFGFISKKSGSANFLENWVAKSVSGKRVNVLRKVVKSVPPTLIRIWSLFSACNSSIRTISDCKSLLSCATLSSRSWTSFASRRYLSFSFDSSSPIFNLRLDIVCSKSFTCSLDKSTNVDTVPLISTLLRHTSSRFDVTEVKSTTSFDPFVAATALLLATLIPQVVLAILRAGRLSSTTMLLRRRDLCLEKIILKLKRKHTTNPLSMYT
mmetsp:Transcript_70339/g.103056  ORF Transcript_70339/g.103056 Transcript_70339/m.103056 type:complete len:235 (-) Transcript_70339:186-890(-)